VPYPFCGCGTTIAAAHKLKRHWIGNGAQILSRFDQKDGIVHGLVHHARGKSNSRECPVCMSRRISGSIGTWFRSVTSGGPERDS
jgi:hypothetical protein